MLGVLQSLGFRKVAAVLDNDRSEDFEALSADFPEYVVRELPVADIRTKPAAPARPEKVGLLDSNQKVRPEFAEPFNAIKAEVSDFLEG